MPVYCTYHPSQYAAFSCPKCNANLCPSCIIKKKNEYYGQIQVVYLCHKCNAFVNKLSLVHTIEPFWRRLPDIFQYTLHIQPIILILTLSMILSFFIPQTITDLIINSLCFVIILTYASLALASSANGLLKPPAIDIKNISNNFGNFFNQLALYILIGLIAYELITTLFPLLDIQPTLPVVSILLLLAFLLMPSMIIMLTATKSVFAAVLPHVFFLLARRIGWPYLALCFFLMLFFSAPAVFVGLIWNTAPKHFSYFLVTLFSSYYIIVSYHLMGYFLYQYHEQVGYKVDYKGDYDLSVKAEAINNVDMAAKSDPTNELLNKIDMLIRNGNYDSAVSKIQQSTRGSITDPVIAERYFSLLQLRQMVPEIIAFTPDYIRLMNNTNQKDKLCEAYLLCRDLYPDFLIDDPTSLFIVGKTLYERNNYMNALKAFDKFTQISKDHPMVPNTYFFIARIFNEQLHDPARSANLIQWLTKKYPFHENTSFIQAYAKQIKI